MTERLAIDGGTPVRGAPFVTFNDAAGRTLGDEEVATAERVIRSGMLSSTWGMETPALEREFAELVGTRNAVAASSGTAALHLAVAAVDPEPGEEIITTPISDFGTVIPILAQNAVPVFADVDPRTSIIDPDSVLSKITPRTRAVTRLREFADEHRITLVEDCAQAYLTEPEPGRLAGTYGTVGCFSLRQSKHVTHAATPLAGAVLLLTLPGSVEGPQRTVSRHGREHVAITADLAAGANRFTLRRRP